MSLRLAFEFLLLFILKVKHQTTPVVRPSFGHEVFFESLVLIAKIDDVETQVLIVFFEGLNLLLEKNEVSLEGDKLNF